MHFHYDDEFCTCGWRVVAELDGSEGYDWHILAVFADTYGRLFWVEAGGCSCNDQGDIEESELAPIDRTSAEYWAAVRDFPVVATEKPRMYSLAGRSRFGVSTHLERNVVSVYA